MVAGLSLVIFTPITRFADTYGPLGQGPPPAIGAAVIAACYAGAWILQKALMKA